jgi:hypothetical protein
MDNRAQVREFLISRRERISPAQAGLDSQGLGRIATVGADGMPHVIPVAVFYEPRTQALVIGSNADLAGMAATKKFRDAHPFELSARDVGRQDLDGSGQ